MHAVNQMQEVDSSQAPASTWFVVLLFCPILCFLVSPDKCVRGANVIALVFASASMLASASACVCEHNL